jgi:hypothetical protein
LWYPGPGSAPRVLDVPEHQAEEQAGQRRADELDDDVTGNTLPGKSPRSEASDTAGFRCAGDRAHEQDDRHHHQARGDDRRSEGDLPLPCRSPPPAATRTSAKVPSNSEQPPPFPARVIEVRTVPEFKREHVVRARKGAPVPPG